MKALVYTQANEVRLLERDAPAVAPGEEVGDGDVGYAATSGARVRMPGARSRTSAVP